MGHPNFHEALATSLIGVVFIYVHTIMHYVHICEMLHGTSGIVVYHLLQIRMKYILIIVVCLGFRLAAFV